MNKLGVVENNIIIVIVLNLNYNCIILYCGHVQCTLYTVQCTLYTVQCTLYNVEIDNNDNMS